jgi:Fur family ferric uptake transcriptional regulator
VAALLDSGGHVTAGDLEGLVRTSHPHVARSTIYRILDDLERLGIVDHIAVDREPAIYHLVVEAHHHLICEGCGVVSEVPDDVFAAVERALRTRYRFTMNSSHLAIPGRCAGCADEHNDLPPC